MGASLHPSFVIATVAVSAPLLTCCITTQEALDAVNLFIQAERNYLETHHPYVFDTNVSLRRN